MSLPTTHHVSALDRFALGPRTEDRSTALTELMAGKSHQRVARTPEFSAGIDALLNELRNAGLSPDRLNALVQLVRISQAVKALATEIREKVSKLLEEPLAPLQSLRDADERGYVARGCDWSSASWVLDYAIEGMVGEDTGETVRSQLAEVVFSRAASLTDIFERSTKALACIRIETETPADSMAVRLTRIIAALRTLIVSSLLPPGESPGELLSEMIRIPLSKTGMPVKEERQIGLARELILCSHDLVRSRFSLATDSDTYTALKIAKRLFGGANWPQELRMDLEQVAASILEAVLLLAKQGLVANSMADHLKLVVGHKLRADVLLKRLADQHPELSEPVRAWLRREKAPQGQPLRETVVASEELRTDPYLARLVLEANKVAAGIPALRTQVLPALQLYEPSLISVIESHVLRTESLLTVVSDISGRRRLSSYGEIGEDVEYSPKYFDLLRGSPTTRARVMRPAVVRLDDDGLPRDAVLKGLVEPI